MHGQPVACAAFLRFPRRGETQDRISLTLAIGAASGYPSRYRAGPDWRCRSGIAALAQPVEHVIRNDGVACSSHAGGTISSSQRIEIPIVPSVATAYGVQAFGPASSIRRGPGGWSAAPGAELVPAQRPAAAHQPPSASSGASNQANRSFRPVGRPGQHSRIRIAPLLAVRGARCVHR